MTHTNDEEFYIHEINKYSDIKYETFNVIPDNNYLRKVKYAGSYAELNGFPYMMKCDNDIFIKSETLDYMIDNLTLLENSNHLTIGPVLTSGIPGIEYFKEQYKEKESSKIDEKIEDLRCKEIKTLLFDEYLRETNNTKTGMQSLTQFFNKK
jgi:hypothetical protein